MQTQYSDENFVCQTRALW